MSSPNFDASEADDEVTAVLRLDTFAFGAGTETVALGQRECAAAM